MLGLGGHVHDRDRRARPAGQGRRARQRRRADARDRGADRVRARAADPGRRPRASQAPLSRLARFGPKTRGTGFWSGLGVGGALGFVCAPCAGPILAAVTSVSASSGATAQVVLVAISYSVGLSRGDAAVRARRPRGARPDPPRRPRATRSSARSASCCWSPACVMAFNLDVRFEEDLAKDASLPAFLVDPTSVARELERRPEPARVAAPAVAVRHAQQEAATRRSPAAAERGVAIPGVKTPSLPEPRARARLHRQPGLVQHPRRPAADARRAPRPRRAGRLLDVHVHQLHPHAAVPQGPVRHLPPLRPRHRRASRRPSSRSSRRRATSEQAIQSRRDQATRSSRTTSYGTWNAYQNQYWPAEYLIDAKGQRAPHAVRRGRLQAGRGGRPRSCSTTPAPTSLPPPMTATAIMPSAGLGTPETYLDPQRAQGFVPGARRRGPHLPRRARQPRPQPVRAEGHLGGRLGVDHAASARAPRSPAASRPPTCTW